MIRWLLNFFTLLSLAVFLASLFASVRAYWDSDVFDGSLPFAFGAMGRGRTTLFRVTNDLHAVYVEWRLSPSPLTLSGGFLINPRQIYGSPGALLALPGIRIFDDEAYVAHWVISSLAFPLPALLLLSRLRNVRWFATGRCPECGYDLRATPARCPECGYSGSASESEALNPKSQ
jgi:hypothetical protein